MRIDTGQHMQMGQQMKLAPRMIQSMEILQLAGLALEERIEQELASNPTLELREAGTDRSEVEAERAQQQRDDAEGERSLQVDASGPGDDDFERLSNFSEYSGETFESNTFETAEPPRIRRDDGERNAKLDAMANTAARPAGLHEQLREQWAMIEADNGVKEAGYYLIEFIDADGYLRTPWSDLLAQRPEAVGEEELETALDSMQQGFDPPGLAARDLRECLLLQIDALLDATHGDPAAANGHSAEWRLARQLVSDHLKDIEVNRLPKIAKALGIELDRVKSALQTLRHLQPRPGSLLAPDSPQVIIPDAIVEYDEQEDAYVARLANDPMGNLMISRRYEKLARNPEADKKTRQFVGQNLRSAKWLIEAIQQRNQTLLRVLGVVLEAQRDYFDLGPEQLNPLSMTHVADQIGVSVGTVSRAVNEKYIQTPRGIVPLRMFFSGGTETQSGDSMSWAAVQAKLKQIIDEEDKANPLSDDTLVEKLKAQGIDIARRTVAKYRKQLGIPPARQRREYA